MKYLWRISRHCDLAGLGGERADGRWHTAARGKRIVYLSEHPALALVEVPANLKGDPRLFPETYQLMKVEMPDEVGVKRLPYRRWRGAGGMMRVRRAPGEMRGCGSNVPRCLRCLLHLRRSRATIC